MASWTDIGMNAASGAANSIIGIASQGLSNLLGLSWSPNKAMQKQKEYNEYIMGLQYDYQQKAAAQEQQYAKEYWDYTNAENQVKHLKNAGLNIGLMYGQSGAGGMGATGGAKQGAPQQPQGNPIGMALQAQGQAAEIELMRAQAAKAKAEASKISGPDTDKVLQDIEESKKRIKEIGETINNLIKEREVKDAEIKYKDGLTNYYNALESLTWTKQDTEEETQKLIKEQVNTEVAKQKELYEQAALFLEQREGVEIDNYIKEKTKDDLIRQAELNTQLLIEKIVNTWEDTNVKAMQIQEITAKIKELHMRAVKEGVDAVTYSTWVQGQINRWGQQTFNERWHLINESVTVALNGLETALSVANPLAGAANTLGKTTSQWTTSY